ncbi:hypothetical protein F3F96_03245 [Mariprofundus sp. NF]|nr:hypothetical protein [Mariprofundus sp. NF]
MISTVNHQKGFVLITSLIMLSLLTLMSLAMFFTGRTATQTSSSAQSSTEAYYYAETAINYINWAFHNDADFDNFPYTAGSYRHAAFGDPTPPAADTAGDMSEMNAYLSDPGPTAISDTAAAGLAGQVVYFDNTPLANRAICFNSEPDPGAGVALTYPNCINVQLAPTDNRLIAAQPTMFNISTLLPRYIKLEIADNGTITASIPQLPHRSPTTTTVGPIVGEDIPNNGAIVWLTAADKTEIDSDIEIFPLQPGATESAVDACTALGAGCPCDGSPSTANSRACDANSGLWLDGQVVAGAWDPPYRVAAYAIGYVNGAPTHLIRAIIY